MKPPTYLDTYASLFSGLRGQSLAILELGVHKGGSINVWRDYFPEATIVGVDVNEKPASFPNTPHTHFVRGSQADPSILRAASAHGPFDIIIDDAAHIGRLAKASFQYLFTEHLNGSGLYILEDWGAALTMPGWPDGHAYVHDSDSTDQFPSYDFGMVGLLKQIIDQSVVKRDDFGAAEVGRIHIQPGLAVVAKRRAGLASSLNSITVW